MAKYILVKKVKGKKYEYQVIDVDSKAIVSKRTSAREYVACTADGSFYFGRLDLRGGFRPMGGLWIWNTWLKEKPPTQWSNAGGWYAVTESDVLGYAVQQN